MRTARVVLGPIGRDVLLNSILNSRAFPRSLRSRAWKWIGHDVHTSALINPKSFLGARTGLTIGPQVFINYGCFIDLAAPTEIGARASLGFEVMLLTSTHRLGPHSKRAGESDAKPITIGEGAWIGARAMIMPGVEVGSGCVIAAGSVVTADCEPDSLYAGVPAVLKRRLDDKSDTATQLDQALLPE